MKHSRSKTASLRSLPYISAIHILPAPVLTAPVSQSRGGIRSRLVGTRKMDDACDTAVATVGETMIEARIVAFGVSR